MFGKSDEVTENPKTYQCPECGLHYADKQIAKECETFCKEHNACSLDITKHSLESQKYNQNNENIRNTNS